MIIEYIMCENTLEPIGGKTYWSLGVEWRHKIWKCLMRWSFNISDLLRCCGNFIMQRWIWSLYSHTASGVQWHNLKKKNEVSCLPKHDKKILIKEAFSTFSKRCTIYSKWWAWKSSSLMNNLCHFHKWGLFYRCNGWLDATDGVRDSSSRAAAE